MISCKTETMDQKATLNKNNVALWYISTDELTERNWLSCHDLLNKQERLQAEKFSFAKDHKRYLITRIFIRKLLGYYLGLAPEEVLFQHNTYGRPSLVAEQNQLGLDFNIAHTDGLIVVALAVDAQVGIDVEWLRKSRKLEVAEDFFSPGEVSQLFQAPKAKQQSLFYHFWTLKESYIKAVGKGLAIPLDSFGFHITDQGITFSDFSGKENSSDWSFQIINQGFDHQITLAVKRSNTESEITINQHSAAPFFS